MSVTATTAPSAIEYGLGLLEGSRGIVQKLIDGVPDEHLAARAGGKGNHTLWIMGHLALSDAWFLAELSGKKSTLDERFMTLFAPGSEVSDKASDYPSRAELQKAMDSARKDLVDWLKSLDEAGLLQETPEDLRGFAPTRLCVPGTLSQHEMMHAGQIASVRSSLSLPRVMM